MESTFNWGIIGPGKIARQFAADLAFIPGARVHAVASRESSRAQTFAEDFQASFYYGNYAEILNCPNLDAVYVATPHVGHFDNTIACLEAGIPVLCEKPLAMNFRQVELLIDTARRKQTFLMEALWTRFLPSTQLLLELIRKGEIGELVGVKADFGFRSDLPAEDRIFNKALGGGALLDIGIYPVFLALLLFGKACEIKAMAKIGSTGVDEDTHVLLRYAGGQLAQLHGSFLADTKREAFIYGDAGTIHMHADWYQQTQLSIFGTHSEPQLFSVEKKGLGYHYEAKEVMDCIAKGKIESDKMSHALSAALMLSLDSIRREIGLIYPEDE
ncbi:MAG: Gfo/Idh/MocA family oxidoreductase [Saprospiraceae bacterium]|nr:Gfo/Idh/MocA family oxidoreductase [Saprospiraceae bacterium]